MRDCSRIELEVEVDQWMDAEATVGVGVRVEGFGGGVDIEESIVDTDEAVSTLISVDGCSSGTLSNLDRMAILKSPSFN